MQNQIISDFQTLDSWEDKYEYIISLSRKLEPYPDELKRPEHFIIGCQSRTWLFSKEIDNGKLHWLAHSDSLFVKGLIYILLLDFQDKTKEELRTQEAVTIQELDLEKYITAGRQNGLEGVMKKLKLN